MRRAVEAELPAIEPDQIGDDREPEPGTRLGLVEPRAARRRLGDLGFGQAGAVVVDVDVETAEIVQPVRRAIGGASRDTLVFAHLQALSTRLPTISSRSCCSPRKRAPVGHVADQLDAAVVVDAAHGAHQPVDHRLDLGDRADDVGARGDAGAVEIVVDLPAHQLGLLDDLRRRAARDWPAPRW